MKRIRNTNTKSNLFITVDLKECILILRKVLTSLYFSLKSRKFYGFSFQFIFPEAVVWRCSVKKVFLDISQKFTGNHLWQSLFFNKVAAANTFRKGLPYITYGLFLLEE